MKTTTTTTTMMVDGGGGGDDDNACFAYLKYHSGLVVSRCVDNSYHSMVWRIKY